MPVTAGAPFRALATTTMFQTPSPDASIMGLLARIARRTPAYEIQIGRGLNDAVERIASVVRAPL